MNKIWHKIQIPTDEQDVQIYPNEQFDGIIVESGEIFDDKKSYHRIYLNEDEMDLFIDKMREMMNYVKKVK